MGDVFMKLTFAKLTVPLLLCWLQASIAQSATPVGALSPSVASPNRSPAVPCERLSTQHWPQMRVINAQTLNVAAPADGPGQPMDVSSYCAITAVSTAAAAAVNRAELTLLLPVTGWNAKLVLVAAGESPAVNELLRFRPLRRGYAVLSSSLRRVGDSQRSDAAYRSVHESLLGARALAAAYYGATPRFTYFDIESAGLEGLWEAQNFPEDFDGVVAVAPGAPAGSETASQLDRAAGNQDISAFHDRGGKIIQVGADSAASSMWGIDAYTRRAEQQGGIGALRRFYRLFVPPAGDGSGDTYTVDWLSVLETWIERDETPDVVLAQHNPPPGVTPKTPPGIVFEPPFGVRSICAYPSAAKLQGGRGEVPVDWICIADTMPEI
jgi:hypothetical protein